MKKIILICLSLISFHCFAGIYVQKDEDGNVIYSDVPKNNSQAVTLNSINSVPATSSAASKQTATIAPDKAAVTENTNQAPANEHKPYTSFAIASPVNNETIQNQPSVTVQFASEPKLQAGDTIQLYMDGQPSGEPVAGTSVTINNISRGTHTLFAKILDNAHQSIKQTATITIFAHRVSTKPG